MIDFRYHLVSVVAIFLALALGIVVGTTFLNQRILEDLDGSVGRLTSDKRGLETTINQLRDQNASDETLTELLGPAAVAGRLEGRRVVLVSAPDAPSGLAAELVPLLEAAGAVLGAQVQVRPDLLDPTNSTVIDDLVSRVAPAGVDLTGSTPLERAAAELSAALLTPTDGAGVPAVAADEILGGFEQLDLIDVQELGERADLAVLLIGEPTDGPAPAEPGPPADGLLSLARALDGAGAGAVVAGPLSATQEGGVLHALREDRALSEQVSSVDNADRPQGRVGVVLALTEQGNGRSGRYGSGMGNEGPAPSLPPS